MKKTSFLIAAIAVVALAGCQQEQTKEQTKEQPKAAETVVRPNQNAKKPNANAIKNLNMKKGSANKAQDQDDE